MLAAVSSKPYVYTHAIGWVWLVVGVGSMVAELAGAAHRRTGASRRDAGSGYVLRICIFAAVVILSLSRRFFPGAEIRPAVAAAVAGLVLFISGEGLRVWARATLGRYFTYTVQTSEDQPVITTGPYRAVRHPSYTGLTLMAMGIGAVYQNWFGLVAMTVLTLVGLINRIRVEETALLADLGSRYREYATGRQRLVPHVW